MTLLSALLPGMRLQRIASRAVLYLELTKPRVVSLIVFTAVVGMLLAPTGTLAPQVFLSGLVGIALAAGAAAAFNHLLERKSDALMARTRARPLPSEQLSARRAAAFAATLAVLGAATLVWGANPLTAALTLFALVGYSVVYTIFLKPLTPQNIVIGGAAGAAPPVLGWTAVTGEVSADALLLFLIIFLWTPPHFWSLALYREKDYANAGFPMLPVTHGSRYTRTSIFVYTLVLALSATLPFATGMSGVVYLAGSTVLSAVFVVYAWRLRRSYSHQLARRTFAYSIQYLAALFALLLLDRYSSALAQALQSFGGINVH